MNYSDIKRYGNTFTVNGRTFLEIFDDISNNAYGLPFVQTKDEARELTIKEILRGEHFHEAYIGLSIVDKMKTMEYLQQDIEILKKKLSDGSDT